mmetsp:Transcript_76237/g.127020  ORF Transcript_76237/g.127020 Transcript_76237/m.127020 type:complete len:461 (-) Transcript_76237:237-1619(-)
MPSPVLHLKLPDDFMGAPHQKLAWISPTGELFEVEPPERHITGVFTYNKIPEHQITLDVKVPDDWRSGAKLSWGLQTGEMIEIAVPTTAEPGHDIEFSLPLSLLTSELPSPQPLELLAPSPACLPPASTSSIAPQRTTPSQPQEPPLPRPIPPQVFFFPPQAPAPPSRPPAHDMDAIAATIKAMVRLAIPSPAATPSAAPVPPLSCAATAHSSQPSSPSASADAPPTPLSPQPTPQPPSPTLPPPPPPPLPVMASKAVDLAVREAVGEAMLMSQRSDAELRELIARMAQVLRTQVNQVNETLRTEQRQQRAYLEQLQADGARRLSNEMAMTLRVFLDELRKVRAAPSFVEASTQAGGWERACQVGGWEASSQVEKLVETTASQTDAEPFLSTRAPPSKERPDEPRGSVHLYTPLPQVSASLPPVVVSTAPRKKGFHGLWYHQLHSVPPGVLGGRYARQPY